MKGHSSVLNDSSITNRKIRNAYLQIRLATATQISFTVTHTVALWGLIISIPLPRFSKHERQQLQWHSKRGMCHTPSPVALILYLLFWISLNLNAHIFILSADLDLLGVSWSYSTWCLRGMRGRMASNRGRRFGSLITSFRSPTRTGRSIDLRE